MPTNLPSIIEESRLPSPVRTPQALACHQGALWIGSRDEYRVCGVDPLAWSVFEEATVPGIPWAATSSGESLFFTSGEGADDDRYVRRYVSGRGFDEGYREAVPEFTGSYLGYDNGSLYLSQWYKHRVLQLGQENGTLRTIDIGAEISGITFANGVLYVLRGTEQDGESWHLARCLLTAPTPSVQDVARVPFACRSLAYDGRAFWTNHRAQNETVAFSLPT